MIAARTGAANGLTARLIAAAQAVIAARQETAALGSDPRRWRRAALLWPRFTKGLR